MTAVHAEKRPLSVINTIELSVAGYTLLVCCMAELVFNRVFTSLGVYNQVGTDGVLSHLALFGHFTMNATGILSLIMSCILLPRLSSNSRFSALPARILLMMATPLYLPVVCVAVFRPVSSALVLVSYLVATCTILFLVALTALNRLDGGKRRIVIALAVVQLLAAFELLASSRLDSLSHKAYMFAEALFIATPLFSFFVFLPGRIFDFIRRPHLPGLCFGLVVAGGSAIIAHIAVDKTLLTLILVAYRSMGITMAVPGGFPVYIGAVFFGAFIVGTLILPSKRWPPDADSRRAGIGLICIWTAGIQPTHPYQVVLVLVGFLYLACSMVPKRG